MPSLLITKPGENIDALCRDFCHSTAGGQVDFSNIKGKLDVINPQLKALPGTSQSFQPIILPDDLTDNIEVTPYQCQLAPDEARRLGLLASEIGGANLMALVGMATRYDLYSKAGDLNTFGGAGLSAATTRSSKFLQALDEFDRVLADYENFRNHRAAPVTKIQAKLKVDAAFAKLQREFNRETQALLQRTVPATRRVTIESPSGPRAASRSIPLTDAQSMRNLQKFAKFGRAAGPGFIALDGYLRVQQVRELKSAGGNWQREAVAQGVGFGTGVLIGLATFAFFITPVGFVAGVVLAGATALAVDKVVVGGTRLAYDVLSE